jgi:hypothetical protein
MTMSRTARSLRLVLLASLLLTGIGCARTRTPIAGKVVDQAGAPIAGATVRVLTEDQNQAAVTVTGPDGAFAFPHLSSGVYQLVVEMPGFHKATRHAIDTTVRTNRQLKVPLEPRTGPDRFPEDFAPGESLEEMQLESQPTALA